MELHRLLDMMIANGACAIGIVHANSSNSPNEEDPTAGELFRAY